MPKLAIRIDAQDNVAMTMEALGKGEPVSVLSDQAIEIDRISVVTDVPLGYHKIALVAIDDGDPVYKYGEIIGYATAPITRGEWIHTHNVQGASQLEIALSEREQ